MEPIQIRIALLQKGFTLTDVARAAKVRQGQERQVAWQAYRNRYRSKGEVGRVQDRIKAILNRPELFPPKNSH